MEKDQFTDRQVIHYKPIHVGEHIPRWLVVRQIGRGNELLRVVGDDYVSYDCRPSSEKVKRMADLRMARDAALAELRRTEVEIARCQQIPDQAIPFTGHSDTLQCIAINASGEGVTVRILRDEAVVAAEDQDIPTLRDWVERKGTGK